MSRLSNQMCLGRQDLQALVGASFSARSSPCATSQPLTPDNLHCPCRCPSAVTWSRPRCLASQCYPGQAQIQAVQGPPTQRPCSEPGGGWEGRASVWPSIHPGLTGCWACVGMMGPQPREQTRTDVVKMRPQSSGAPTVSRGLKDTVKRRDSPQISCLHHVNLTLDNAALEIHSPTRRPPGAQRRESQEHPNMPLTAHPLLGGHIQDPIPSVTLGFSLGCQALVYWGLVRCSCREHAGESGWSGADRLKPANPPFLKGSFSF